MEPVTRKDREHELRNLIAQMEAHPERDWSAEKQRAEVLREMLKDHSPAE